MYLRECNGLQADPSLMSTGELKENYARVSNSKSIFAESLSSGTPFRRRIGAFADDRIALSPIEGAINMSPHFSRLTESQMKQKPTVQDFEAFEDFENDEGRVDLQATGNFSSIGSKTGNFMTHQPNTQGARYARL
jgi:hypothetical protein